MAVSGFGAALVSGAAGFGGALLLLPVVTASVGAQAAVPVLTIAQLIGNISRMAMGWRQIDWKSVQWFSLSSLPLAALGAFGFSLLPKDIATRCIGAALVALALVKLCINRDLPRGKGTLIVGGAVTGGLSGLCGSGGPIGAAVFLSLGLPPVAYIASEAATATAMHILKTAVYSNMATMTFESLLAGVAVGVAMIAGTFTANRIIKRMEARRFQKYVAVLLCVAGLYMMIAGA